MRWEAGVPVVAAGRRTTVEKIDGPPARVVWALVRTGFNQHYIAAGILTETGRKHAARGTSTNDDDVCLEIDHRFSVLLIHASVRCCP